MKDNPQHAELTRLISGLLDGRLSIAEHEHLESLLAANADARRLYMQMIDQEIELPCIVASLQGEARRRDEISSRQNALEALAAKRTLWRHWGFRAAVALGMVILVAVFALPRWFGKHTVRPPQ